ncbi:hypothetical protein KAX17_18595 [Candidatus Bipolaricaulota bacterium]|nr:hypothetical protein [Candidatus Bipolaricaulota bacterium]
MMDQVTTDTFCGKCGEPIYNEDSNNRIPCPNCGAKERKYHVSASINVSVSVSVDAEVISYPQSFLNTAKDMIDKDIKELQSMAVILCHVASEIATDRALMASFEKNKIGHLKETICSRFRSRRLANKEIRKLYTGLTGDDIAKATFWPDYQDSVQRRDDITHRGILVSKADAEKSHAAATELVKHLEQ